MELLSPAGNLEKLRYAYLYGADAAYIGIRDFSLRARADNFSSQEWQEIRRVKGDRKLYGALNIYFHKDSLDELERNIDYIAKYPFDAFIVSDLGAYSLLRKHFPNRRFHLSTQANCINREAAGMYRDMGFDRIILGRETGLDEIADIRDSVPDVELEVFVHGAMCLAYSGRCFLSRYLADRSANEGDCTHSCRWNYRVLEEKQRPGEYFPVIEGDGFTTILSSKDLCMFDYLPELKAAGIDSIKIEGRMKSLYYTAVVTRSYRKALDRLEKADVSVDLDPYREELYKISRREFSTGFYLDPSDADRTTTISYLRRYVFNGTVKESLPDGSFALDVRNQIRSTDTIEFIGPDLLYVDDNGFALFDENGRAVEKVDHGKTCSIRASVPIESGYIIRTAVPASAAESLQ